MKFDKLACIGLLSCTLFANVSTAKTEQPNILWIITDDHRPDSIQAYNRATIGQNNSNLGYVSSPNIDKLASEGVLFTKAYNQSPACGPSRTSMHSGRYPFRNGKYAWEYVHQEADFSSPAVSQSLKNVGYQTAIIGKTHHGMRTKFKGKGPIFDFELEFNRDLYRKGFGGLYSSGAYGLIDGLLLRKDATETVIYPNGSKKTYVLSKKNRDLTSKEKSVKDGVEKEFDILRAYTRINKGLILGGVNPQPADKTVDARIVEEFNNYLKNENGTYKMLAGTKVKGPVSDKPLFINLGFHLPHTPVLPPKEYRDKFKNKTYKVPVFDSDELATFTPQQMQIYNESKVDSMKSEDKQQAIRDYYAFTAFGDSLVGKAVKEFKQYSKEQGREYLIVFTVGDHGWHLGEQGVMAKFGSWKESLNGAVIVVSSDKNKFPAGKVVDKLVEYVDFAPTLMSAGNIDIKDEEFDYLDGVSLLEVANDSNFKRDYILGEMNLVSGHRAYLRTKDFAFSMRTRDKRTVAKTPFLNDNITWALTTDQLNVDLALYDLRNDPLERDNVAYTLEYNKLANWYRNKLGNIVLGDGRIEMDWSTKNSYNISNFAAGSDDKLIEIPAGLIPPKSIKNLQRPNW
jgi:arylsulfatase A-like enzyme